MYFEQINRQMTRVIQRLRQEAKVMSIEGPAANERVLKLIKKLIVALSAFILERKMLEELVLKSGEGNLFSYVMVIVVGFSSFCLTQKVGEGRCFLNTLLLKFLLKFIIAVYMRYDISPRSLY